MRGTRRGLMAAAACAVLPVSRANATHPLDLLGHRLAALLGRPPAAHRVAAVYLAGLRGVDWRRAALDLDMLDILAPMERIAVAAEARDWLASRVRADFENGAVTDVAGWRLSRAEVGTCVLVTGVA